MSTINTAWPTARVGALCEQIRGVSYSKGDAHDKPSDGLVPILRANNILDDGVLAFEDLVYVPPRVVSDAQYIRKHDIVLATSSGSLAVVGKAAPAKQFWHGAFGAFCKVLRPNSAVEPRYLAYFFRTPQYRHRISRLAAGANINNLRNEHLNDLEIPLPPLPEQKRIADILDKADAIRRKRQEALLATDRLIHSWFMRTVGPDAAAYHSWSTRTVEELAVKRPGSMRTGPFGSDLKHSEFVDEGIAVLGIDNAVNNRFTWSERRYISEEKYEQLRRYQVFPGDVIITIMGTVGRSAVVPNDIPTAINTKHLACITLDREVAEPEFVSQSFLRHPEILRQLGSAGRGAIMTGLNLGIIKALRLPIPPIQDQRRFANGVAATRKNERMLSTAAYESNELFNSLVQRAFKGAL